MTKYHIKVDGNPGICKAAEGNCPYGADAKHFDSKQSAQEYAEKAIAERFNVSDEDKAKGIIEKRYMTENEFKEFKKLTNKLKKTEMLEYAKSFTKDNFGIEMDIPIKYAKAGKARLGCYSKATDDYTGEVVDEWITINPNIAYMYANGDKDAAKQVFAHELTHFALSRKGEEYADGSDNFESTIKKLNVISSDEGKTLYDHKVTEFVVLDDEYTNYDDKGNEVSKETFAHTDRPINDSKSKRTGIILEHYRIEK